MQSKWGLFWRGMSMGAVETIPGVSSGTLALITGIYAQLIETLANIHPRLLVVLRQQGVKAFWQELNGNFLLFLFGGMVTIIVPAVRLIKWFLENAPVPLWAFFCGLIVMGTITVWRSLPDKGKAAMIAGILGCVFSLWISRQAGLDSLGLSPLLFFFSGALAICAMLLPGISGSFILLLLGMYEPILTAVSDGHISYLAAFLLGCAAGAMMFVQLLKWLLARHYSVVMAAAAGVMLGSLVKLWPWKIVAEGEVDILLLPAQYAAQMDVSAHIGFAVIAFALGIVAVFFLGDGSATED